MLGKCHGFETNSDLCLLVCLYDFFQAFLLVEDEKLPPAAPGNHISKDWDFYCKFCAVVVTNFSVLESNNL